MMRLLCAAVCLEGLLGTIYKIDKPCCKRDERISIFFFLEELRWTFDREIISVTYQTTTRCLSFTGWYWALWKRLYHCPRKLSSVLIWDGGFSQVRFKEMSEMRANHCRGVVNNKRYCPKLEGRRPEEISQMCKSWQDTDLADSRHKDGMTLNQARLWNKGNLSTNSVRKRGKL